MTISKCQRSQILGKGNCSKPPTRNAWIITISSRISLLEKRPHRLEPSNRIENHSFLPTQFPRNNATTIRLTPRMSNSYSNWHKKTHIPGDFVGCICWSLSPMTCHGPEFVCGLCQWLDPLARDVIDVLVWCLYVFVAGSCACTISSITVSNNWWISGLSTFPKVASLSNAHC